MTISPAHKKLACFIFKLAIYNFYSLYRDCSGANVSSLVGADFCDRPDLEDMLKRANSDRVKCIYNPGPSKRIRFSYSCQSSFPSHESLDSLSTIYSTIDFGFALNTEWKSRDPGLGEHPSGLQYNSGYGVNFWGGGRLRSAGVVWEINQNQAFRIPSIQRVDGSGQVLEERQMMVSSVLFCRELMGPGDCRDNPLRGARRSAKIFVDGIEVFARSGYLCFKSFNSHMFWQVAYGSHIEDTSPAPPINGISATNADRFFALQSNIRYCDIFLKLLLLSSHF